MGLETGAPETDILSYIFDVEPADPEKPILIDASDPSRFLTFATARTAVRKLIAGLRAEGLRKDDCVCINAFNDIYYSILMLAIIGAGGRFTGSNPSYTSFELNHHIRVSQAKFLVTEPQILSTTLQSAEDCGIPESRVFTFETKDPAPVPNQKSWTTLLEHGEADWLTFDKTDQARSTIATLSFTSGTTGFPKAAMISHLYMISQFRIIGRPRPPYEVSRLVCVPAFHAFAVPLLTGCAIRDQHAAYVMRRFELAGYLRSIRQFQITEIPMVPTMLIAVLNSPATKTEDLQSLRTVRVGGSPLRSSTQKDFQSLLHSDALVTQLWGMTETGWTTMFLWPESDETGSVGRLQPGISSKLVAEDGSIITEDNREGELFVKGASIMNGYFNDPVATAATIDEDGWLRTGDIAYCIKGKWYIVDRKKDLIKHHGWQIAPAELEAILLTHPQVINAAVIGIPLADGTGETPQAFVVLKPNPLDASYASHGELEDPDTTEEELKAYLGARLAKYKALSGVCFVEDIPRTPSGKVQKFKLRELHTAVVSTKKENKRKRDVLETIGERDAALSNSVVVPAVMNGASDPVALQKAINGQNGRVGAELNDAKGVPVHEPERAMKRVHVEVDVDCSGSLTEGKKAAITGGTLANVSNDPTLCRANNGRPVDASKTRRKRVKIELAVEVEVEVEVEYDGALREGANGIITGGTLMQSEVAENPVNGVH